MIYIIFYPVSCNKYQNKYQKTIKFHFTVFTKNILQCAKLGNIIIHPNPFFNVAFPKSLQIVLFISCCCFFPSDFLSFQPTNPITKFCEKKTLFFPFIQYPADIEQPDLEDGPIDRRQPSSESNLDDGCGCVMAIHSCPNSPTETDSSSGFSTLRRRSVTLTEKVQSNEKQKRTFETGFLDDRMKKKRKKQEVSSR